MNKLFILLPVHNRRAITMCFMESLVRQEHQNYHLVLIDDGSSDGTEEMVRSYIHDITVIRGKGDWWWGGSLHQGYLWLAKQRLNEDDMVLIINDDTEFGSDYLTKACDSLRSRPRTLLISRCYDRRTKALVDTGAHYIDLVTLKGHMVDGDGEANYTSTRGLFMRASDMLALGGFLPRLLPHYLSDVEYTLRAHKKGLKLESDSQLTLFLDEEATGYHDHVFEASSLWVILKKFFSKKSSANPVYWTAFVMLVCPLRTKFKHVLFLWAVSIRALLKQLISHWRGDGLKRKKPL